MVAKAITYVCCSCGTTKNLKIEAISGYLMCEDCIKEMVERIKAIPEK